MTPEWLKVGAEVVAFTPARGMGVGGRITPSTVAKVGKRDVVLANGSRFPVRTLRKTAGTWDSSTELLPADAPVVLRAEAANRKANREATVTRTHDEWRVDRTVEKAEELRDAVLTLLDVLAEEAKG